MKNIGFVGILIVFTSLAYAQQTEIAGNWLVTKVEKDGKIENPYMFVEFKEHGEMIMMGMEVATWDYNKKKNVLLMKSDIDKDFNGESKIINLTDKELVLERDRATVHYKKLNLSEIETANNNSGMIGLWEFTGNKDALVKNFIDFKTPDVFKMIQKAEGSESTFKGTWIFDQNNRELLLIGFRGEDLPIGKSDILEINEESVHLSNNGLVYKLKRKDTNTQEIERLTFTQEDFFTENGDFKYNDDEEKLPWKKLFESEMNMSLLNVNQLVYNQAKLIRGFNGFENKTLTANVEANLEEGIDVDNVFIGYDRFNLPDDFEFPSSSDYTNALYPLEENTFRIVGNEQITTPAGTFECTVLEVLADSDVNKKLWMINDKFGVYAKIIEDDQDEHFGHYYIYELQEIK